MRRAPFLAGCESAIRLMATTLILPPAVDATNAGACIDRWREQRIAEIAIEEFGDEARAQAGERLHRVVEGPGAEGMDRVLADQSPVGRRSFGFYQQERRHVA